MAFFKKPSKKETVITSAPQEQGDAVAGAGKQIIGILRNPHITEKTAAAGTGRTYVFVVDPDANKQQIKQAVESRYNVSVTHVRVVNIRGKEVRRGRIVGWRKSGKKAYTTVKEGQQIEVQ